MSKVWKIEGDLNGVNLNLGDGNKLDPRNKTIDLEDLSQTDVPEPGRNPNATTPLKVGKTAKKQRVGAPGTISVGGIIDDQSNIVRANGVDVKGNGNIVQDEIDSIILNPNEEKERLDRTKRSFSGLRRMIRNVDDRTGINDLMDEIQDGHFFVTAEFLMDEFIKALQERGNYDPVKSKNFAILLINSGKVNRQSLQEKLLSATGGANTPSEAQKFLIEALM